MELFDALKFEIKKGWKSMLIFGGVIGLLFLVLVAMYDPAIFEHYNEIIESLPPELLGLLGGQVDLGTFSGYFNMYTLEFAWMWFGLYLILKVAQDIPGEMENKTIDLVLSKPIKRWEYVLSKQLHHIITIFVAVTIPLGLSLAAIGFNTKILNTNVNFGGILLSYLWLTILLWAIESTVLLISTVFRRRSATAIGFAVIMVLWFIPAFSGSIPIDNIEYISIFQYFNTRVILIDELMTNVVRDILILVGWSVVMSVCAIIYFMKRDIPV
ncbi:MAG: ABC transporter permease subunit [Candidatus Lokiarchaeota archaeon]|nr:ABC transporter permease subunit [Candidatus Lokiarchaeota archaeon]